MRTPQADEWLDRLDEVEVATPAGRDHRWQIRDQGAVLVLDLPGGQVEVTPRGRRCEVRADVPIASLSRLILALEALGAKPPEVDAVPVEVAPFLD